MQYCNTAQPSKKLYYGAYQRHLAKLLTNQEPSVAYTKEDQTNSKPLTIAHMLWENEEGDGPLTPHSTNTYSTNQQ